METTANYQETPATPAEIWAILRETALSQKETDLSQKETDRRMKETDRRMKETDRRMKETDRRMQETDRKIDKLYKSMGGLRNSMGHLTEAFFRGRLWELLDDYSYGFSRPQYNTIVYDDSGRKIGEIDILLTNSERVMAVEVKTFAKAEDLQWHIKLLEKIQQHPPPGVAGKKILGAVAAAGFEGGLCEQIHSDGLFAFSLKGEQGSLVPPPEGFKPKEW